MRVKAEGRHIEHGKQCQCYACPIALAVCEAAGTERASVDGSCIQWRESDGWKVGATPEKARQFITAFDNGDPVQPFEFELEQGIAAVRTVPMIAT